jgi:hypothetical protein
MENFSALDPRKQELLEARLLGNNNKVRTMVFYISDSSQCQTANNELRLDRQMADAK